MTVPIAQEEIARRLETARLSALYSFDILDTPAEEPFDRITRLAAELFGTPMAAISLIDATRQWFKAKVGIDADETGRDVAFCDYAIRNDEVLVVEDATKDPRFAGNPMVTGDPNVRFYAGAPLRLSSGMKLGSMCVIDSKPGQFSDAQRRQLAILAQIAVDEMELRLKTEQLEAAKVAAESAAQAKGDFLANMSHELRTPLTAIIGFSGLMTVSKDLGERERHFAERIQTASKNLLTLINDVLDFAKLEAGRIELQREPVDLSGFLTDILGQFNEQANGKGVALRLDVQPGAPALIEVDPQAVRQILLNLLSNAMKFTADGEIVLAAEPLVDGGLSLSVRDTGVGIAPDRLDSVFERFVQADRSISRKFGGTGLGLSISRRLAELMGATLTVSSKEGKGSVFDLRLPAA